MYYAQIRKNDIANGTGIRVSLFVSGCTLGCKNCFNKEYQDFCYGKILGEETVELLIEYLSRETIRGLTLLGGEPMDNAVELAEVLHKIKQRIDKEIWIYSGYTFEQILQDENKLNLLRLCDVLVDGRFVEELKDLRLKFRGSSNQRIINIKESIKSDRIILIEYI